MKKYLALGLIIFASQSYATQTRCGWFSNPTPANAWLDDVNGEWIISTQGAGGASASGDWPDENGKSKAYWAVAPGASPGYSYGYGCACITGTFDTDQQLVLTIVKSKAKPLAACRKNPKLAAIEPKF